MVSTELVIFNIFSFSLGLLNWIFLSADANQEATERVIEGSQNDRLV